MLISTTPNLEGKPIRKYLGIVSGEAIMGANIVKDFFAAITDVIGGRSSDYEKELERAKKIALDEMQTAAHEIGANAIVGVDLDYETIGKNGSMLMVSASGTAVVTE